MSGSQNQREVLELAIDNLKINIEEKTQNISNYKSQLMMNDSNILKNKEEIKNKNIEIDLLNNKKLNLLNIKNDTINNIHNRTSELRIINENPFNSRIEGLNLKELNNEINSTINKVLSIDEYSENSNELIKLDQMLEQEYEQINESKNNNRVNLELLNKDPKPREYQTKISNYQLGIDSIKDENKNNEDKINQINYHIKINNHNINELENALEDYNLKLSDISSLLSSYSDNNRVEIELILKEEVKILSEKIFELSRNISLIEQKLKDLKNNEGLTLSTETLECFNHISKAYTSAFLGKDFIKGLSIEEKEKYLDKTTLIPYSILLNDTEYRNLYKNDKMREKIGYNTVPIINMNELQNTNNLDESVMFFNTQNKNIFLDEDRREKEIEKLENQYLKLSKELESLKNNLKKKEENYLALSLINKSYSLDFKEEQSSEINYLNRENNKLNEEIVNINKNILALNTKIREKEELLNFEKEELIKYEKNLKDKINIINENLVNLDKITSLNNEKKLILKDMEVNIQTYIKNNLLINDIDIEISNLKIKIKEIEIESNNLYSEKESIEIKIKKIQVEKYNLQQSEKIESEKNIRIQLKIKELESSKTKLPKDIIEIKTNINLEQAKNQVEICSKKIENELSIIDELEKQINILENQAIIKKREIDSAKYTTLDILEGRRDSIMYNDVDVFKSLEKIQETLAQELEGVTNRIRKAEREEAEIKGKIISTISTMESIDIAEHVIIPEGYNPKVEQEKVNTLLLEINNSINDLKYENKNYKESSDTLFEKVQEFTTSITNKIDDLGTIIRLNEKTKNLILEKDIDISLTEEVAADLSFTKYKAEKRILECERKISSTQNRHIQEIEQTLERLEGSIFEFVNVLRDIKPPTTKVEIEEQKENILGQQGYLHHINREREGLNKELEDLNVMKETFIVKCVNSVEMLIAKLKNISKFSTVIIDGIKKPLIELKLQELIGTEAKIEKMTNYINTLLTRIESDEFSLDEKVKALNESLTSSKLLEQGIKSLNNCEFNIYVPNNEDIKNGYYEKWGGGASSGQRNLMYLTATIALIIFIRETGSLKSASQDKKVVFADGPFRGAQSSYLWELIFKLMKDNNIQFIVTNYNTPINLMNMFDSIALIIGKKVLVEDRKITQNVLGMDSRFIDNSDTLRGDSILHNYGEYRIPVKKVIQYDENQMLLDI